MTTTRELLLDAIYHASTDMKANEDLLKLQSQAGFDDTIHLLKLKGLMLDPIRSDRPGTGIMLIPITPEGKKYVIDHLSN